MDYKVRTTSGQLIAATSTTEVVLWNPQASGKVSAAMQRVARASSNPQATAWTKAARDGSSSSFRFTNGGSLSGNVALRVGTLAETTLGVQVLIDAGSNEWRIGTVVKAGSRTVAGDSEVDNSARATQSADTEQQALVVGATFKLVDEDNAEDGSTWFRLATAKEETPTLRCTALSTVGAIGSGKMLVETAPSSGTFAVVEI